MKIIVLQNTYCHGKTFKAGEAVEFDDNIAARLVKANLAHPAEPAEKGQEAAAKKASKSKGKAAKKK